MLKALGRIAHVHYTIRDVGDYISYSMMRYEIVHFCSIYQCMLYHMGCVLDHSSILSVQSDWFEEKFIAAGVSGLEGANLIDFECLMSMLEAWIPLTVYAHMVSELISG